MADTFERATNKKDTAGITINISDEFGKKLVLKNNTNGI
jgi:hypothetical protein